MRHIAARSNSTLQAMSAAARRVVPTNVPSGNTVASSPAPLVTRLVKTNRTPIGIARLRRSRMLTDAFFSIVDADATVSGALLRRYFRAAASSDSAAVHGCHRKLHHSHEYEHHVENPIDNASLPTLCRSSQTHLPGRHSDVTALDRSASYIR